VTIDATLNRTPGAGSILLLFGPSNAGKTTILRAVAGVDRPTDGTIAFAGETWVDVRAGRFVPPQARRVAYVAKEPALFAHFTARGNVEYGLSGRSAADRRRRGDDLREALGIRHLTSRRARGLSGGEAQRVALV
jgi:molybdate transport system ATP-binding protein